MFCKKYPLIYYDMIPLWIMEYRKTIDFFIKTKGLHGYFERNGGSLEKAVVNAHRSMDEKQLSGRDYTYSELGRLMEELKELE